MHKINHFFEFCKKMVNLEVGEERLSAFSRFAFRRHTDGTSDYIGCEAPESDSDLESDSPDNIPTA